MNKKGQGISMTYIVIAALALVVLVVIILFFTGALGKMFEQQQEAVGDATEQQKSIWRTQCSLYVSLGQEESYDNHEFGDDKIKCSDSKLMDKSWTQATEEKTESSTTTDSGPDHL